MNCVVAYEIMAAELAAYRQLPLHEPRQLVDKRESRSVRGQDDVDCDVLTFQHRPFFPPPPSLAVMTAAGLEIPGAALVE